MEHTKEISYIKVKVWVFIAVNILMLSGCASIMHDTAHGSNDISCTLPFTFPEEITETRIIMLGDLHGTHEAPQLAAELACTLARKGFPVTLAIEMPHDEQAALDAYIASDGGDTAQSALLTRSFWKLRRDGLNTVATLAMIDRIRLLRQRGNSLAILPIDASSRDFEQSLPQITTEQEQRVRDTLKEMGMNFDQQTQLIEKLPGLIVRERSMAKYMIAAMRAEPSRRFVVFLGNGHTSKLADVPIPGRPSMASALASQVKSLLSLNIAAIKYTFWGCLSERDCGKHEFEQPTPLREELVKRGSGIHIGYPGQGPQGAYDGTIIFENTTPAKPAVDVATP